MAGDWIKWQKGLSRKPEVVRMASVLRLSRREVASMCMEFWEWCDETIDESTFAPNGSAFVTLSPDDGDNMAFIDTLVGTEKFADSLTAVEWLRCRDGRIELPGFSLHNGETAKTRARNAKNQKKKRDSDGRQQTPDKETPQGCSVTKMSPRHGDKTVTREREREESSNTGQTHAGEDTKNPRMPMPESLPSPDAAIHGIATKDGLLMFQAGDERWTVAFVAWWNEFAKKGHVHPWPFEDLDDALKIELSRRMLDPKWHWKLAGAEFPLDSISDWKPSLPWFLEMGNVGKIIGKKYKHGKRTGQAGLFGGGAADPTRVRTGKTSAAISAAMAQAAASRGTAGDS